MLRTLTPAIVLAATAVGLSSPAWSQSGDVSGAMQAESGTSAPTSSSKTAGSKATRSSGKKPTSLDMNTAPVAPTGPDTSTEANNGESDLSGSTGASVGLPAAPAPPGVAPPGGIPDTGNGGAPTPADGPH